jgi:hypothetical protein
MDVSGQSIIRQTLLHTPKCEGRQLLGVLVNSVNKAAKNRPSLKLDT